MYNVCTFLMKAERVDTIIGGGIGAASTARAVPSLYS